MEFNGAPSQAEGDLLESVQNLFVSFSGLQDADDDAEGGVGVHIESEANQD